MTSRSRPRAVIFDIDGLMFDTERLAHRMWRETVIEYGYSPSDELMSELIGRSEKDILNILSNHFGPKFPTKLVQEKRLHAADTHFHTIGMSKKDGLEEILQFLESSGIRKAVATSTLKERAMMKLRLGGVTSKFETIVTADDVARAKPAPDLFLKAVENLNLPSQDCLVLEDAESGVLSASAAGTRVIMVVDLKEPSDEVRRKCELVVHSLHEVKEYLEALP